MNYLALYRKYRPNILDDVVGQEEIKKILANSVINNTISHAYLFSGPRGTGKTTMAKILAKMVNCEAPIDGCSCNKCNSCLNIFNSSDIIEIDAASNNGVDEIRNLREKANLVPGMCKYKVYIIDEVHMLTTQAFNALLKTLEEPPKHVIFILATTEYHKIPLTITSRCQKFQFCKIDDKLIVDRLKYISKNENIDITDEALFEIAKLSDGGMRDSINFLDQIRSFKNEKIDLDDVFNICGNVSLVDLKNLLFDIKNNNVENITIFFENMNINGKNYNKFFDDFVGFLKDIILFKNNVSNNLIGNNIDIIRDVSNVVSIDDLFLIVDMINNLINRLKFTSRQSTVVITNFLFIANKLCENKNLNKDNDEKNDNYDLAFKFTSVDKENKEVNNNDVVNNVDDISEEYIKNKDILINNTFAVANKEYKLSLQNKFTLIDDYLTDKKYSNVAGMLIDIKIEVAGDKYVLFSGKYDAVIDNIHSNYKLCCELLNKIFDDEYNYVFVSNIEWDNYKNEYINNIKSGKKYSLIEYDNRIVDFNKLDKEPTIVDKLFDIVGEENIEFK